MLGSRATKFDPLLNRTTTMQQSDIHQAAKFRHVKLAALDLFKAAQILMIPHHLDVIVKSTVQNRSEQRHRGLRASLGSRTSNTLPLLNVFISYVLVCRKIHP
jgi:hypothetical protein